MDYWPDVFLLARSELQRLSGAVASAPNSASVVAVTFGNWFAVGDYHFPLVLNGGSAFVAFPGAGSRVIGTHRAVLGNLPPSRARIPAIFSFAAPVRVRILTRVRRRFVRPAGRGMGNSGDHFGLIDRFFPTSGRLPSKMDFACSAYIARATLGCSWVSSPCITGPEQHRLIAVSQC